MGRELRLPAEIDAFLSRKGPVTLLVRGPAGSGKTTLALAMLEAFYGRKIFMTGRRSQRGLLDDYPWLGSIEGHQIEIVDTVVSGESEGLDDAEIEAASPPVDETVLAGVMDALPPALRRAWGRRGGVKQFPREFAWVPPGMRRVFGRLASDQRAMVVVDPWDAFIDELLDLAPHQPTAGNEREQLERTALRLVGRGAAHLVLVLERERPSQIDYLVDGIIVTRHESRDGTPERWISIPKLRGIRIDCDSYPYTLEGGRFTCIAPEPRSLAIPPVFVEPEAEPSEGTVWPGSRAFQEAFGPLRVGELTLIETDGRLTDSGLSTVVFPLIASTLRQGGRILFEPPPSLRLIDFWNALAGSFTPEAARRQLRIIAPGTVLADDHPLRPCLLSVPRMTDSTVGGPSVTQSQIPKGREFVTGAPSGSPPGLTVFASEGLAAISAISGSEYTPQGVAIIVKSYMTAGPLHIVFSGREGDPFVDALRSMASIQLNLRDRQGRIFAFGRRPLTPGYVLTQRGTEEERAYNLLRIV